MPKQKSIPSYRLHKQSGQAIVTLTDPTGIRKDFLLGKYDSPESRTEYVRVVAEWETAGRLLIAREEPAEGLSVNEVILAYYHHAEGYYQKNGRPTKQLERVKRSLRFLKDLYGGARADTFGPLGLKAVREKIIDAGYTRTHVNQCVGCIKRMFKWGVENELIPPTVFHGLVCVGGLKKDRSRAKEGGKIQPVPDAVLEATLPFMLKPVAAMARLQRLTGMRPGEVVLIRPRDIDRSGDLWLYRPESHKTQHHGGERVIVLGKQAQEVLAPFLLRGPDAWCFSPKEAVEERSRQKRAKRKTRVQPSQQNRRRRKPRRVPRDGYDTLGYAHSIYHAIRTAGRARACDPCKKLKPDERCEACRANAIPHWHPHQLRHTHATEVRKRFGLEGAQVALGHTNAAITEIYAERDLTLAQKIAREIG